jgi:hypothetical protein
MNYRARTAWGAAEPHRISIEHRSGVWRVTLDGRFHGDYARRYWAIEGAFEKADDIAANGGSAIITMTLRGEQNALIYDTRSGPPASPPRSMPTRQPLRSKADLVAA